MGIDEFTRLRQTHRPQAPVILSFVGPLDVANTVIPIQPCFLDPAPFRDLDVLVFHCGNWPRFAMSVMERLTPVVRSLEYVDAETGDLLAVKTNYVKALTWIPRRVQ